jgi:hypothetical protein
VSATTPAVEAERVIVDVLSPVIGRNIAAASTKGYLARLQSTTVDAKQAEQLVGWIAPGLKVFVGDAKTAQVVGELRIALSSLIVATP